VIELSDVSMSYRSGFLRLTKQVLKKLSFQVREGAIVGYLGINGAGKTTTIKLIAGINRADQGRVSVAGIESQHREARALLGYLPENPYFYEYLTPREVLEFFARLHGIDRERRKARITELLERVRLKDDADRQVREFSKGMRQRLGLAQALVHNPKLLVLDEPLTGLDPMGRLLLRELILDEREQGRTIFFSSHVLSDVQAICDDLVIIDGGAVAYSGGVQELLAGADSGAVRMRFRRKEGCVEEGVSWGSPPRELGGALEAELASRADAQIAIDAIRSAGGEVLEFVGLGLNLEEYFLERFGSEEGRS